MSFFSLLFKRVRRISRSAWRDRPASRKRPASSRPRLEFLEDRTLPATITWTGDADNATWHTPGNWDISGTSPVQHRVPGSGDDVVIRTVTSLITYSTGSTSIHSLTTSVRVNLIGGTLTIDGSGTVPASTFNAEFKVAGGSLGLNNTIVNGSGPLINAAGKVSMTSSTVNPPLDNESTLSVQLSNQLKGQLTTGVLQR